MSTRILLRLSFIVSRTKPSVMERFVGVEPPACSSSLEQLLLRLTTGEPVMSVALEEAHVSSSLGELNRAKSLKGVLLRL